jgi:hypothetical protein
LGAFAFGAFAAGALAGGAAVEGVLAFGEFAGGALEFAPGGGAFGGHTTGRMNSPLIDAPAMRTRVTLPLLNCAMNSLYGNVTVTFGRGTNNHRFQTTTIARRSQ